MHNGWQSIKMILIQINTILLLFLLEWLLFSDKILAYSNFTIYFLTQSSIASNVNIEIHKKIFFGSSFSLALVHTINLVNPGFTNFQIDLFEPFFSVALGNTFIVYSTSNKNTITTLTLVSLKSKGQTNYFSKQLKVKTQLHFV